MPRPSDATILLLAAATSVAMSVIKAVPRVVVLHQGLSYKLDRHAAVSADGRFVAFVSAARLMPGDQNDLDDVYVFDRERHTLTLETAAFDGAASNGNSGAPSLSADGRYLVFDSHATNITFAPDINGSGDVFLRDRLEPSTRRISVGARGQEANDWSGDPVISADGRVVAFVSRATNLVAGADANGESTDVYLTRLDTGAVERISIGTDGRQPVAGHSGGPALSADGRIVAFMSTARFDHDVAERSRDLPLAVFARDLSSGVTTCLSCSDRSRAFSPDVSADGRFVVFTRDTDGSSPRRTDVVLIDRTSLAASVLTRRGNDSSSRPKITADGRFIVFESMASNLECERRCPPDRADENLLQDIYVFDRLGGAFTRVSGGPKSWWAPSIAPHVDAKGDVIVFSSREPIDQDDHTTDFDLFVWSRTPSAPPLILTQRPHTH